MLTEPLPAAVRTELGQRTTLLRDTETPPHHLWFTADHRALFAGGDQKRPPDRLRDKTLVQRTGELMYELTRLYPPISGAMPAYGGTCRSRIRSTACSMPARIAIFRFITLRSARSHDPARAFLASRIILRSIPGRPGKRRHALFVREKL